MNNKVLDISFKPEKEKIFFVITIQSSTIYKFDNLDRPIQAQIFYNKSRFTKKNYQFYE